MSCSPHTWSQRIIPSPLLSTAPRKISMRERRYSASRSDRPSSERFRPSRKTARGFDVAGLSIPAPFSGLGALSSEEHSATSDRKVPATLLPAECRRERPSRESPDGFDFTNFREHRHPQDQRPTVFELFLRHISCHRSGFNIKQKILDVERQLRNRLDARDSKFVVVSASHRPCNRMPTPIPHGWPQSSCGRSERSRKGLRISTTAATEETRCSIPQRRQGQACGRSG